MYYCEVTRYSARTKKERERERFSFSPQPIKWLVAPSSEGCVYSAIRGKTPPRSTFLSGHTVVGEKVRLFRTRRGNKEREERGKSRDKADDEEEKKSRMRLWRLFQLRKTWWEWDGSVYGPNSRAEEKERKVKVGENSVESRRATHFPVCLRKKKDRKRKVFASRGSFVLFRENRSGKYPIDLGLSGERHVVFLTRENKKSRLINRDFRTAEI